MKITEKKLKGAYDVIIPLSYIDQRGSLVRFYNDKDFYDNGFDKIEWRQQFFQHSKPNYVLRGLHCQSKPYTESKLITIVNGKIFWVFVDVRKKSPTFGKWDSAILEPNNINGLFIKPGFAHGCVSLEEDTMLIICADNYYMRDHGIGILYNDPEINIDWPIKGINPIISEEHKVFPSFSDFKKKYGGI